MADIDIPQSEADSLIAMEKHCVEDRTWFFPSPGGRLALDLVSPDKRESFVLDITRATIKLTKATYQNRARQAIILLRLDLDGPPHPNPGSAPPGMLGYCLTWARHWHVRIYIFTRPPRIEQGLFS